jgi:hypothetical protein
VQVACTELGRIPVPDAQPAASLSPETPG